MRARSRTSASLRGLPAGSRILAEYIPGGEPGSRLTSTLGTPANRGDVNLDVGSDLGGDMGSDLGGAEAVCLGAGSFTLAFARRPAVVPVAVCGAGGALLSAAGSRLSRADAALASSLAFARRPTAVPVVACGNGGALLSAAGSRWPRQRPALPSPRADNDGSPPARRSVALDGASDTARGAALCLSE